MPSIRVGGRVAHFAHRRPLPAGEPAVVLVHGAGGSHQHWLYQVRDLAGRPSYAIDLPGHGRSDGPGRDSISAYAEWLVAFLDAAGLARAVLVGHSMGGAIAQYVALNHPERVAGLGLVATGARLRVAPAIFEAIRHDYEAAIGIICDWAYGPGAPTETVLLGRRQMAATPPDVLYDDFRACDAFDVMGRVTEIAAPTAVICGTQDRLTPAKYSTYLHQAIRGSTLHLVEGAGHMVMVENPEALEQALGSLLERV